MFHYTVNLKYLVLVFPLLWMQCSSEDTQKRGRGQSGANVFPVRVIIVEPSPISLNFDATGTYQSYEEVEIAPERAGRIVRFNFEEGQDVAKNAVLAYIDDDQISSQIKTLSVRLENVETKLSRAEKLKEIDAVSQEELDDLRYQKKEIESQINELRVDQAKSVIRAPFSGKVGFRSVSPGAYVNAGETIVNLIAYHPLKATFNIPEEYAREVQSGDTILIRSNKRSVDSAVIDRIAPKIDPTTRAFTARALIPNEKGNIMPGSFANIEIPVYHNPTALLVPAEAIIQKLGGEELYIVRAGKAKTVDIETGIRNENFVEVLNGINKGDSVIITGLLSLSDGVSVEPTVATIKTDL